MQRPATRQWIVLWIGVIWIIVTLLIAEEYVIRGVAAALLVIGLLYWQLAPKSPVHRGRDDDSAAEPDSRHSELPADAIPANGAVAAPSGVAGWLALLVFGLGIGLPLSEVIGIWNLAETAADGWQFGGSLIALTAVAAGSVYSAVSLWRRWPNAPKTAFRFILAIGALGVLEGGLLVSQGADTRQAATELGRALVWPAVWGTYLRKSRRVKNTYCAIAARTSPNRAPIVLGVAWLAVSLIWLGGFRYSTAQTRIEQQYSGINPYQWMKAALRMEPTSAETFAKGVIERQRHNLPPKSTITSAGNASFDDLGSALRAVVRYGAEFDAEAGGKANLVGELRSYFHANGVAVIESGCVPALLRCEEMERLILAGETALLTRLNSSQLAGILPEGKCSTESVNLDNGRTTNVVSCSYTETEAASLSLTRSTLAEASLDLRSRISPTSKFKRAIVRQVFGNN